MDVLSLVTNQHAPFFRQQLDSLAREGVESRTVAVSGSRTVTDTDARGRSSFDYVRFYGRVLRASAESIDLVHANYGLTAPMALAQPRRPVVLSFWGSDLSGRVGQLSRQCARRADAVIVMSEQMAGMLPVDAHVIPHGVDLSVFRPASQRMAREAVGWRHEQKHVLFPYAKQRPVKNYPRAAAVVKAVERELGEPVPLQTLHGVDHERMPDYMNAADALLVTSHHEGSPNAVKEALACNLPVVSTAVGDVAERLDGVNPSFVCETDEALQAGLLAVLGRGERSNGRQAVEPLGIDRMGKRLRTVYDSVLSR